MWRIRNTRLRWLVLTAAGAGFLGAVSTAKAANDSAAAGAADRSQEFVEKSVQATNLFNERRMPEALAAFQDLVQNYGDLDQDGFLAMSLGDCLHAMGRDAEARKVYESLAAAHPELASTAGYRIREIDISESEPTDALIEQLRKVVSTSSDDERSGAQLQLGRALQKRAVALLKEAVEMFRTAAETDKSLVGRRAIANQSMLLAQIQEDLASLVERIEKTWGALRTLGDIVRDGLPDARPDAGLSDYRATWTVDGDAAAPVRVEANWAGSDQSLTISVNGRPIHLNASEEQIIRRHLERASAIAVQSARKKSAAPANGTR